MEFNFDDEINKINKCLDEHSIKVDKLCAIIDELHNEMIAQKV